MVGQHRHNVSEREIETALFSIAKKASLLEPRGGRTAGDPASLTSTCRPARHRPATVLTQLLTKPIAGTQKRTANWLPDQWKRTSGARSLKAHALHIALTPWRRCAGHHPGRLPARHARRHIRCHDSQQCNPRASACPRHRLQATGLSSVSSARSR